MRPATRAAPRSGAPKSYVSAASVWETKIKVRSGRLSGPDGITALCGRAGLCELPILPWHTDEAARVSSELPHRDPFDATLVTQAALEGMALVTAHRHLLGTSLCRTLDVSC